MISVAFGIAVIMSFLAQLITGDPHYGIEGVCWIIAMLLVQPDGERDDDTQG